MKPLLSKCTYFLVRAGCVREYRIPAYYVGKYMTAICTGKTIVIIMQRKISIALVAATTHESTGFFLRGP